MLNYAILRSILGQCYNIQKRASVCKETMNVNKICLMVMMMMMVTATTKNKSWGAVNIT